MNRVISLTALLAMAAASACAVTPARAAVPPPAGVWLTYDENGVATGKVEIWQQNDLLYGKIVAIADPTKAHLTCTSCTDDRHDAPLLGLQFMRGLHQDGDRWTGGNILDPKTGEIYRCTLRVIDGGAKLQVRGFLGISLFGRTQTWKRDG